MRIRNSLVAALLLLLPQIAIAEAPAPGNLPEATDDLSPQKILNSQNLSSYKEIVPLELQALFRNGQLEIEAASGLKVVPSYGEQWAKASGASASAALSGQSLRPGTKLGEGFVFGDAASLAAADDSKVLAQKILWNIYSVWAAEHVFGSQFEFHWFKDAAKPFRTLRGEFDRIYPLALPDSKQLTQLFRELIRFTAPAFLNDLAWLTFRFVGSDEDILWVYSPAVQKLRQLTAANRSDPILRSAVSPEDFLVWSGKPELADARAEPPATMLAPFLRAEAPAVSSDKTCVFVDRAAAVSNRTTVRWNFESSRYLHGAGWVPSTSILIPRSMWRIELVSQDPFSLYGRQILYVDTELMLPIYKVVYNRSGQLWKTVIGSYGLAGVQGSSAKSPYPAYTVVIDHLKNEAFVIDFSRITMCAEPTPPLTLADFDPKRFTDVSKRVQQAATPTPAVQVPAEEPDER